MSVPLGILMDAPRVRIEAPAPILAPVRAPFFPSAKAPIAAAPAVRRKVTQKLILKLGKFKPQGRFTANNRGFKQSLLRPTQPRYNEIMVKRILLLSGLGALLAGCASAPDGPAVLLPPVANPAVERENPGQVIWHDLATRDLNQAKGFYGGLFGWTFEQFNPEGRQYTVIYLDGSPIGGMFTFDSDDTEKRTGEWLINLSSGDVAADAAKFAAAGGEILEKPREVPNRGTAAFVRDPQKAVLVLTNSSSGDPEEGEIPLGGWLWNELWTHDATAALFLYEDVFGYDSKSMDSDEKRDYYLLGKDGIPLAGILEILDKEVRPHWVPFVRVADVRVTVTKALSLGGSVLIEPDAAVRDGTVAVLRGPGGEPFVVQEFEFGPPSANEE
jgi:predicted enzyme related to lactoylglutathione lyase